MKRLTLLILSISLSSFGWVRIATEFLKDVEGFSETVYICPAGKKTIGYGFTDPKLVALGHMSEGQATNYLQAEVMKVGRRIMKLADVSSLTDHQFAALISLCFNIGMGNFRESTLLKNLRAGELQSVPYEFSRWNKITNPETKKKEVSNGLVNRRNLEIQLWNFDIIAYELRKKNIIRDRIYNIPECSNSGYLKR